MVRTPPRARSLPRIMSPKTELAVAKKKEVMSAIGPVKITFENVTYTVDNGKKLGGKRVRCVSICCEVA